MLCAGTGERAPLGQPVTIEGLRSNDTYVCAVALYDGSGQLVGGLGDSSPQLLVAHALPLLYCWSHLLLAACQLGVPGPARRGAQELLLHFISKMPERPVWQANPMDCLSLDR